MDSCISVGGMLSNNVSCVGEMLSKFLPLKVNISNLALFTVETPSNDAEYMFTTNYSTVAMMLSGTSSGDEEMYSRASVN